MTIFVDMLFPADPDAHGARHDNGGHSGHDNQHDDENEDEDEHNGIVDGGRAQCDVKLACTPRKSELTFIFTHIILTSV